MEMDPNQTKYMSREEYEEEFKQTGGDDFLQFLQEKLEEAWGNGELEEHINSIYKMVEYEEEQEFYMIQEAMRNGDYYSKKYKESLEGLGVEELKVEYEKVLAEREECKKEIKLINNRLEYGDLLGFEANKLYEDRGNKEEELKDIEIRARILQNKIKIEELKSRIIRMTPEEIVEEYMKQLAQKQGDMARRKYGIYYNPTDIEFINETIELIETHSTTHPELETLIAKQKEHKDRIEQGQEENLSSLSIEELLEIINRNSQTIACNEQLIKQALTQKILEQQQQIAEQKAEINRLQGQKVL